MDLLDFSTTISIHISTFLGFITVSQLLVQRAAAGVQFLFFISAHISIQSIAEINKLPNLKKIG